MVSKAATDGSVIFCEKLNDFELLSRYWAEPLPQVSMDGSVQSTSDRAMASRNMRFIWITGNCAYCKDYKLASLNDSPRENITFQVENRL